MSFSVTVAQDGLSKAMRKLVEKMPGIGDVLVRKIAFDVVAAVAELVPVDTGRYRAGWRVSLDVLANDGASGETVSVFQDAGVTSIRVTNPVEYAPFIEYGTATRPPGNHLALALEQARIETVRLALSEEVKQAWREST